MNKEDRSQIMLLLDKLPNLKRILHEKNVCHLNDKELLKYYNQQLLIDTKTLLRNLTGSLSISNIDGIINNAKYFPTLFDLLTNHQLDFIRIQLNEDFKRHALLNTIIKKKLESANTVEELLNNIKAFRAKLISRLIKEENEAKKRYGQHNIYTKNSLHAMPTGIIT